MLPDLLALFSLWLKRPPGYHFFMSSSAFIRAPFVPIVSDQNQTIACCSAISLSEICIFDASFYTIFVSYYPCIFLEILQVIDVVLCHIWGVNIVLFVYLACLVIILSICYMSLSLAASRYDPFYQLHIACLLFIYLFIYRMIHYHVGLAFTYQGINDSQIK